jgi:hypothetical protein
MDRFNPPARVDDFARRPNQAAAYAEGWSAVVEQWLDDAASAYADDQGRTLFFNPRRDTSPGKPESQPVPWDAFPRFLQRWFRDEPDGDRKRWRAAEVLRPYRPGGRPLRRVEGDQVREPVPACYRQQDEYCEWFVDRDPATRRVRRMTFTCEGPEYWRFLAMGTRAFFDPGDPRRDIVPGDITLVGDLYRQYVSPDVRDEDLVWPFDVARFETSDQRWHLHARAGDYNPLNRWNTTHGAMHLTHPANTLGAEINLAGGATVPRRNGSGQDITDTELLICCAGYGEPNRSSDPSIGAGVNAFARRGLSVSLADPVGLYIADFGLGGLQGPNGEDVSAAWHADRGDPGRNMLLRGRLELPQGHPFTLDQLLAGGVPLEFGGQAADRMQMVLTAVVKDLGVGRTSRQECEGACCPHPHKPVRAIVAPGDSCDQIPPAFWERFAPLTEPAAECGAPAGGAAPLSAEALEDVDEAIAPLIEDRLPRDEPSRLAR